MSPDPILLNVFTDTSTPGRSALIIILLVVLIILSACFSATETAYSSLNEIRVKNLAKMNANKKGVKNARRVYNLYQRYSQVISTILIGNNIVNLAASAIVTYLFTNSLNLGGQGVLWATIVVSVVVIIFGEIIPKNIAKLYPEKIASWMSVPLQIILFVFYPITILFSKAADRAEEHVEEKGEHVTATEDELLEIVDTIEKEGVIEQGESEIIKSAINFDDKIITSAMIDKSKVLYVYDTIDFENLVQVIKNCPYSRIPVYSRKKKQVVGIIRQRDVFDILAKDDPKYVFNIYKLMRIANVVSYRRILPYALEKMQKQRAHMLIVVDNIKEKDFLGIVTMEDLLEELVGEIYDEGDKLPKNVVEIGHHIFEVKGDVLIEDFFDDYLDDTDYPRTECTTMGDWIKRKLKKKPHEGDEVIHDNIKIKVTSVKDGYISAMEVEQFTKQDDDDYK